MTTPDANQEGSTPSPDDQIDTGHIGTSAEHVDGHESEEDAAMEAGFAAVSSTTDIEARNDKQTTTDTETGGRGNASGDEGDGGAAGNASGKHPAAEEDPEIPGLGKASVVRASLQRLETFEKTLASTNGHLGHLKSLVQQAGKGKTITADSLPKIREEFGAEYAEALAADLNAAGIGGGGAMDDEALTRVVTEQLAKGSEAGQQKLERRLVLMAHKDAFDYFTGGPKNTEFSKYVQTLPKEKQDELANTWDSDVIIPHLDAFKASQKKAIEETARQQRRIERGTAPTQARNANPTTPTQDPMEAGFRSVQGTRGRLAGQGARR